MARAIRPRRSRRTLTTLLVLVLLSVTIITLDETGKASFLTSGAKSVASDIYSPLRSGVNGVIDPIGRFFAGALDYGSLEQENQKLRNQIVALEHRQAGDASARRQYDALQRLLATDRLPSVASLSAVVAQVTAQSVSDFAATISVDKGRDQGVTLGDPVVGPGGLVGQVVTATHTTAIVRLLTDGKSQIGVSFGHHEEATLGGTGAGRPLQIQYVPSTAPVSVGELIVTSGLQGGVFPPGIPVAKVTSVHSVVGAADKQISARSLADLYGLSYVEVIQWSGSS
ncbi:MAG TPA: rod shape-determining protein MreC [Acidimicrobiales bacterium]|nr:rod shape-determining protein MreC [Acidimicrobiales bacterium]